MSKAKWSSTMNQLFEMYSTEPDERFKALIVAAAGIEANVTPSGLGCKNTQDRPPTGDDYNLLFGAVMATLRMKETYVMPPQQVTLTPATIEAIVERVAERKAPTNPKIAYISVDGAQSVADHLYHAIEICPPQIRQEWRDVRDALQAIANDTDQIRIRP